MGRAYCARYRLDRENIVCDFFRFFLLPAKNNPNITTHIPYTNHTTTYGVHHGCTYTRYFPLFHFFLFVFFCDISETSVYSVQAVFTMFVAMHRLSRGISSSPPSRCIPDTLCIAYSSLALLSSRIVPRLRSRWLASFSYLTVSSFVGVAGLTTSCPLDGGLSVYGLACWSRLASGQRGVRTNIIVY